MSLRESKWHEIPEETKQIAQKAFPKGNVYMTMRDNLDLRYTDSDYADLFGGHRGRPAESPGRLNQILVMQHAEGLSDRQAAEAVRSRIDWKYALGLSLEDAGFHHSILGEHRQRLLSGGVERGLLDDMLVQLRDLGLLKERGQQRSDSTHVLASIRELNRLECLGETLRQALNHLAEAVPEWLLEQIGEDWFELYGPRFEQYRLPKGKEERERLAERIGADGYHLLNALYGSAFEVELKQSSPLEMLRLVWIQHYLLEQGQVQLRKSGNLPPGAQMIQSPYDVQARFSQKRQTRWVGYKVHVTETCDEDMPRLITNVETTMATTPDSEMTATIHKSLHAPG